MQKITFLHKFKTLVGEHGTKMDPSTSILNTLYNVLNGEVNAPYKFSGPFYNQVSYFNLVKIKTFSCFII